MARPKTTSPLTGLCRVKNGKIFLWPSAIMSQLSHPMNTRGKGGYVVDLDKPYEKFLCRGMHRFLEPVPEAQQEAARASLVPPAKWPRPIVNHLAEMKLLKRSPPVRASAQAKLAANAAALAPSPPELIPDLDAPANPRPSRGTSKPKDEGVDL